MPPRDLRLAVHAGATNADAVVVDARDHPVAVAKVPRGRDVPGILRAVLRRLLAQDGCDARRIGEATFWAGAVEAALVRRRGLRRVAALRIGAPLTLAVPPLASWPDALRAAVSAGEAVVTGGAEYDGRTAAPLGAAEVVAFLGRVAGTAEAVAITSVFSPVAPEQELAAADLVRRDLGAGVPIALSHEHGSMGLIERENATVLNAALGGAVETVADQVRAALEARDVDADLFLAQGDGAVMALEHALRFPALMLGAGPASAMLGAGWLSGIPDGVVVDAGGATVDVGVLLGGTPRPAPAPALVAGVRANVSRPDLVTLPFGGRSALRLDDDEAAAIGVDGQGDGLVFGGAAPTLVDAAVAADRIALGTHGLTPRQRHRLAPVMEQFDRALEDAVGRARRGAPAAALVAVGGAAALVPRALPGVGAVFAPAQGDVAGAFGLAIAPAGGHADRICVNRPTERATTMEAARADAVARAVHAGADPRRVAIVEADEVPLSYLHDPAIRIRVRAAGPRLEPMD
jgi:N-methylhydantoinase A/oxoprolinase/acetone carboxylase beta subunit